MRRRRIQLYQKCKDQKQYKLDQIKKKQGENYSMKQQ